MQRDSRWSIWIDIEGFSSLYPEREQEALMRLGSLMSALYRIGSKVFVKPQERLFIHQFGDGFIVVSEFEESTPDRPVALAIAVMRHVLCAGGIAKAAVSAGTFADVRSQYPAEIHDALADRQHPVVGEGIMTIMPVMGSALVNAHKLSSKCHGGVLLVDVNKFHERLALDTSEICGVQCIDWIHSVSEMTQVISQRANLILCENAEAEFRLEEYLRAVPPSISDKWVANTLKSVGLSKAAL